MGDIGDSTATEAWDILVEGSLSDDYWQRLSAVKAMAKKAIETIENN
ncbi:MAG: hypothetical protein ABFS05_02210 [Bacteroidota bacterium]